MTKEGQYIYAIVNHHDDRNYGPMGIGGRGDEVFTLTFKDIGAVVSSSPVIKYPVSRKNTMAHQKVIEEVMRHQPVLPVKFGTVGEGVELIRTRVLEERYDELKDALASTADKVELGLKVLWTDMGIVFQEVIEENTEIKRFKDRLMSKKSPRQSDQVRLGEMVKKALETKKQQEEAAILEPLVEWCALHKQNRLFGDAMVTNSAFLVPKENEKTFDNQVNELSDRHAGRMKFQYVGPVPPYNFVEIVITW